MRRRADTVTSSFLSSDATLFPGGGERIAITRLYFSPARVCFGFIRVTREFDAFSKIENSLYSE